MVAPEVLPTTGDHETASNIAGSVVTQLQQKVAEVYGFLLHFPPSLGTSLFALPASSCCHVGTIAHN